MKIFAWLYWELRIWPPRVIRRIKQVCVSAFILWRGRRSQKEWIQGWFKIKIKITSTLKKIKITTYHFEEEADYRRNDRKIMFLTNRGKNDEVDAITIRKYDEK